MDKVRATLSPDEIIDPSSPSYKKESETWSAHKNKNPKLVARPKTMESLAGLLKVLNETDLDINVRCGGCGSASAHDVLISMSAFDGFEFDSTEEVATVGAGQLWRHVDAKVEQFAPGYSVPGARCTYVGVGGSTLQGGVSWMSSEYGLTSDPHNMLDAQIVKMNGEILWASKEPDLLWALRGGGGRFGVVTAFKLKAYRYPQDIYSGMILFPREALETLAVEVPKFATRNNDSKVAMHFYCLDLTNGGFVGQPSVPGIGLLVYDAHGEKHGRENAFKWALEIPGATDSTRAMTYKQVNELNDMVEPSRGLSNTMMTAAVIPTVTSEIIRRTWKWFEDTLALDARLNAGTFVLIEMMQVAAFNSVKDRTSTAWPRAKNGRHILQIGTGVLSQVCTEELQTLAKKRLADAGPEILDDYAVENTLPRDFEDFHDPIKMFGENVDRLRDVKKRVDPNNKLQGAYTL